MAETMFRLGPDPNRTLEVLVQIEREDNRPVLPRQRYVFRQCAEVYAELGADLRFRKSDDFSELEPGRRVGVMALGPAYNKAIRDAWRYDRYPKKYHPDIDDNIGNQLGIIIPYTQLVAVKVLRSGGLTADYTLRVLVHELGHLMGLHHDTADPLWAGAMLGYELPEEDAPNIVDDDPYSNALFHRAEFSHNPLQRRIIQSYLSKGAVFQDLLAVGFNYGAYFNDVTRRGPIKKVTVW